MYEITKDNEKKLRHVKFVKEALFFFKPDDHVVPIEIIFLPGLTVTNFKYQKNQEGFTIKHRDGVYPEKHLVVKGGKAIL